MYWVVRESVRKALEKQRIKFDSKEEILESVKKIGVIKYSFDCSEILKKSRVLNEIKTQKNLKEWF